MTGAHDPISSTVASAPDPEGLHLRLSPLAYLVLQQHRAKPDLAMYDIAVLGTLQPSSKQLDTLAEAYRELETAELVQRTNKVERFRDRFFYMYKPGIIRHSGTGSEP